MKKSFLIFLTSICVPTIYGQTLSLPQLVEKIENSIFTVYAENEKGNIFSQGSGFVISRDGVCITNFHVLENAYNGYVQNKDGEKFNITKVIDYNVDCDLVKFRIDNKGKQFYALPLSMTKPQKGEEVVTLSTPIGLEQTLSNGIVSSIRESELYGTVIQMTAPISHGSSGSPILNRKGEVLGVSTFGVEGGQNLNFAVSTLNFSKINKERNVNLQDITKDPLETPNIKKARLAMLESNYETAYELAMLEFEKDTTNHLALFLLGNIYLDIEDYSSAIDIFIKAIELHTEKADYFNFCGLAFRNYGDIEFNANKDAGDMFMFALKSYDMAISIERNPTYYFNKGNLIFNLFFSYKLLDKTSLYDAMNNFNVSIQLNPYSEEAYVHRAAVKNELSDHWGAISDCDKAIAINPSFYRSYFIRGDTKGYFLNDQQAGIKDLEIALSLVNTNKKDEKADILGLIGVQKIIWANNEIDKIKAQSLLNDAKKHFKEAFDISGKKIYLEKLNTIIYFEQRGEIPTIVQPKK